ncbi:YciI family protein [Cellulomonas avistercoris]|uniref:YciI family protein n=1 Tax=Cellulomonas avistercoris TaxID=2762242 RepID=UPI00296AEE8C|nr:YciI family protein [Cellulomonas avistercoris]
MVRSDGRSGTTVTEGPFTEFSEWLAGFQVVDVADEARAVEIAARVSAVPGRGGVPCEQPVQVRRVVDGAIADAATMRDWLGTADGS